jgi:hypothetical protein
MTRHIDQMIVRARDTLVRDRAKLDRAIAILNVMLAQGVHTRRRAVLEIVSTFGPMRSCDVADMLGQRLPHDRDAVAEVCWQLAKRGDLRRVGRGVYAPVLPPENAHAAAS